MKERGSSLLEMIGVMGIIGVVALGAWGLINSARTKYKLSQGVLQLQSLQKGVARFYAAAGNYNGLREDDAIESLIENRVPPHGMATSLNELRNIFGTAVEIKDVPYENESDYGSSSDSFSITFKSLKAAECVEMASIVWLQHDGVNLVSVTIGEVKYVWPASSLEQGSKPLPVTRGEAMEQCKNAPMDIKWEFR